MRSKTIDKFANAKYNIYIIKQQKHLRRKDKMMEARYHVYELEGKEGKVVFEGSAMECYDFLSEISEERKPFMWVA